VGLGLAVSKGFVEAVGGELELEDTPGGGCTMVVRLPATIDRTATIIDASIDDDVLDDDGPIDDVVEEGDTAAQPADSAEAAP